MKKWYCFAALLCAAALLAGCAPIEKQTADASSCGVAVERGLDLSDHSKEDYVLCAEENGLKLYVQPSTTAFYVETAAQEKWFSCPEDRENDWFADGIYKMEMASLMVVQYTDTSNGESSRFNTMTGSVYDNTYRLSTLESGFRVDYEFSEYNVTIPLCVYLEDGMLRVRVLLDQIEKQDGFFIRSIALLPFFGAGGEADEGYLFVADGEGGIIRFNNGKNTFSPYQRPIYGQEPTELPENYDLQVADTAVRLPVYGIRRNDAAFLAVVEESAASGQLCAYTNLQQTGYANTYVDFQVMSEMDYDFGNAKTPMYEEGDFAETQIGVAYRFLSGDDADYSGMARSYRQYLIDGGVQPAASEDPALYLNLVGGVNKTVSRLGIQSKQTVALTTTEQVVAIASWLRERGVDNLVIRYTDWQKQELAGKTPDSLKIAGTLQKGGVSLSDLLNRREFVFYPSLDAVTTFSKAGFFKKTFGTATDLSGVTRRWNAYSPGLGFGTGDTYYRLSAGKRMEALTAIGKLADKYDRLACSDIVNELYNDFRDTVCKRDRMSRKITSWLSGISSDLLLVNPNAYAFGAAERITSAPITSSGQDLIDVSVPFYGIVMSGLRTYASQPLNAGAGDDAVLRALESGTLPAFTWIYADVSVLKNTDQSALSGCGFVRTRESAVKLYALYSRLYTATEGSALHAHSVVADGVTVSTYENGATVYINFNEQETTLPDGTRLAGRSCRMTKGGDFDEQTTPPVL